MRGPIAHHKQCLNGSNPHLSQPPPAQPTWADIRQALDAIQPPPLLVLNDLPPDPATGALWRDAIRARGHAGLLWTARVAFPALKGEGDVREPQPMRGQAALDTLASWMDAGRAAALREAGEEARDHLRKVAAEVYGGLPLALRLVAQHVPPTPADWPQWAEDVAMDRMLYAGDSPDEPEQASESIRAAFELSWRPLTPEQRRRFALLGLFPPEFAFGRDAVAALWSRPENALPALRAAEGLRRLDDLSLVEAAAAGERWRLHPLLAEFAREKLRAQPALRDEGEQAMVQYYQRYADAHWRTTPEDLDALAAEWPAIRAAFDLAVARQADAVTHDLAVSVARFILTRGYWAEGRRIHQAGIVAARRAGDRRRESRLLHESAILEARTGDVAAARGRYEQSLEINRRIGDAQGEAATLHELARLDAQAGDVAAARSRCEQSLEINRLIGDAQGEAATLHTLGMLDAQAGDVAAARSRYEQSLDTWRRIGDARGEAATLHQVAILDAQAGDVAAARSRYEQSLAIERRIGNVQGEAATLHTLGMLDAQAGDMAAARSRYEQSLEIKRRIGYAQGEASTLVNLGQLLVVLGEGQQGLEMMRQAVESFRMLGMPGELAQSQALLHEAEQWLAAQAS